MPPIASFLTHPQKRIIWGFRLNTYHRKQNNPLNTLDLQSIPENSDPHSIDDKNWHVRRSLWLDFQKCRVHSEREHLVLKYFEKAAKRDSTLVVLVSGFTFHVNDFYSTALGRGFKQNSFWENGSRTFLRYRTSRRMEKELIDILLDAIIKVKEICRCDFALRRSHYFYSGIALRFVVHTSFFVTSLLVAHTRTNRRIQRTLPAIIVHDQWSRDSITSGNTHLSNIEIHLNYWNHHGRISKANKPDSCWASRK